MLDDRFWTKVDKSRLGGCWVWTANKNNKGYGMFRPGGSAPKRLAHRLAYESVHGRIPRGSLVLHSCDNPSCVNPSHLRSGTHKDNTEDMDTRERRVVSPMMGENNGNSKMTAAKVVAIRTDYISGVSTSEICTRYGCSETAVHDYTSGRSWTHLFASGKGPTKKQLAKESRRRTRNNVKLTLESVTEIKKRLGKGETGKSLALEYGVHFATISDIKTGKTWTS